MKSKHLMGNFRSIFSRLLLAFGIIILLSLASNAFVYLVTSQIEESLEHLSSTSLPLVEVNANLRKEILISINETKNLLMVKAPQNQNTRTKSWLNIDAEFEQLQRLAVNTGYASQKLQRIKNKLNLLRAEQLKLVSLISSSARAGRDLTSVGNNSSELDQLLFDIFSELDQLSAHVRRVTEESVTAKEELVTTMVFTLIAATLFIIVVAGGISVSFSRKLRGRIEGLLQRAHTISSGSFKTKDEYFQNISQDELGQLSESFNHMTLSLSATISAVKRQSRQVGHSSHQVAMIAGQISEVAKQENASYSEVMQVTESFMDLLIESLNAVEENKVIMAKANEQAETGIVAVNNNIAEMTRTVDVVTQASHEVEELKSASEQIDQVTLAISTVADQTALIALNAAIEAARAGEQGRGFAVVADEVRSLAQRTATSTDEIRTVIGQLLNKVDDVINLMTSIIQQVNLSKERSDESGAALQAMTNSMAQVIAANEQISSRSSEQNNQMQEMQYKLQHLFNSLQVNSEKAQIVSLIGNDLNQTSELVNQMMESFKFDDDDVLRKVQKEDARRSKRLEARVKIRIEHDFGKVETICRNMSRVGLGIQLSDTVDASFEVDEEFSVHLFAPKTGFVEYVEQQPVVVQAKVVRSEQSDDFVHTDYGLELLFDDEEQRRQIDEIYAFFDE